jgi:hypothetical protein
VLVELKAVVKLENVHLAQAINYLEAFNLTVGLLINFGSTSLEFKRLQRRPRVNHGQSLNQNNQGFFTKRIYPNIAESFPCTDHL